MNAEKSEAQIQILVNADTQFARYELEFEPEDAAEAATTWGHSRAATFIAEVNTFLRNSNHDQADLHSIRLGRRFGDRIVIVDLFKGAIQNAHLLADEIQNLATANGASWTAAEESGAAVEVIVRWYGV